MSDQQPFGRTFFDLISEHPKKVFVIFIIILIIIIILKIPVRWGELQVNSEPKIIYDTIVKEVRKTDTIRVTDYKPTISKKKKAEISVEDSTSKISVQNQPANINTGTNNGIIGNNNNLNVKVDEKQRKLSVESKKKLIDLISQIREQRKDVITENIIEVSSVSGSREAFLFATEIIDYLKSINYNVGKSVGQFQRHPVINGVLVEFDSGRKRISIAVGY